MTEGQVLAVIALWLMLAGCCGNLQSIREASWRAAQAAERCSRH